MKPVETPTVKPVETPKPETPTVKPVETPKPGTQPVKPVETPKPETPTIKPVETPKLGTQSVKPVETPTVKPVETQVEPTNANDTSNVVTRTKLVSLGQMVDKIALNDSAKGKLLSVRDTVDDAFYQELVDGKFTFDGTRWFKNGRPTNDVSTILVKHLKTSKHVDNKVDNKALPENHKALPQTGTSMWGTIMGAILSIFSLPLLFYKRKD